MGNTTCYYIKIGKFSLTDNRFSKNMPIPILVQLLFESFGLLLIKVQPCHWKWHSNTYKMLHCTFNIHAKGILSFLSALCSFWIRIRWVYLKCIFLHKSPEMMKNTLLNFIKSIIFYTAWWHASTLPRVPLST